MASDPLPAGVDALAGAFMSGRLSRRQFVTRLLGLGLSLPAVGAIVAACTTGSSPSPTATASTSSSSGTSPSPSAAASGVFGMTDLISKAKAEGSIYQTGIPPEWANYAGMFDLWKQLADIPIDGTATEGEYSSGQELDSIKNTGKPDVGDVGLSFGPQAKQQGLVANYMNANWADIPANLKDADGAWAATYYGAMSFIINTDAVKIDIKDWTDLMDPSLKNAVGIDGDPNKASDSFNAVLSAAYAKGSSVDDIGPGVDFFNALKAAGNLTPARCTQANMLSGEVKVGIKWDYLALADRDKANGAPNFKVVVPSSGATAGPYVALISAKAPHPNAARLWNELLYSDEGQLNFLKGYAHPIRYSVLDKAGKIPADLAAKLPPAASYANVQFVTDLTKLAAAQTKLKSLWTIVVNS
ncbi:MAG: ABC transporter substrate-binding protein [Chloroflexota bacterium]|nr:MAG: ABC transporter substrate-binding protein [Chloroflexota bacterium]